MKALVMGGFLGSGKTTAIISLAKQIIESCASKLPVAILENEVGEVGVDDKILKADGYSVRELFAGCACCSLAAELPGAVKNIEKDLNPDWVIIEPTGLAIPANIKSNLENYADIPTRIVTLVDGKRWRRIKEPLSTLLKSQLDGADNILVNKSDLIDSDELEYVQKSLREFNADAPVWPICAKDGIEPKIVNAILGIG